MTAKTHSLTLRVHYEDTDMAGIVYYANYLKFIERGRSAHVRSLGIDQLHMRDAEGLVFAVRHLEADYLRAARFDDLLTVETGITAVSGARMTYQQTVLRGDERIFAARVTIICMTLGGRPVRFPAEIRRKYHEGLIGNP